MNKYIEIVLKGAHKVVTILQKQPEPFVPQEFNPDNASELIYNGLKDDKPFMAARLGSVELQMIINTIGVTSYKNMYLGYVLNRNPQCWWNRQSMNEMKTNAGFFPTDADSICKFTDIMLQDIPLIDILGSWLEQEKVLSDYLSNATKVKLLALEPYWSSVPWSRALEGKKVLVVHPFANSIWQQYEKRTLLFNDNRVLPTFKSLTIIPAVQSLGGDNSRFSSWFEALEYMQREIDKTDFDVALIGCGAYGLPLAAHVKRNGKKAIHLGGALQLLFGIKGKRWLDPNYGKQENMQGQYLKLFNDYWSFPSNEERPATASNVENACYWQ